VLLVLLLVCHVALRWFGGPSIRRGGRVRGPERVLEIRWSAKNGRIVRPAEVRRYFRRWIELRLADGSAIALLLGRSARMQIADAISSVGHGGG